MRSRRAFTLVELIVTIMIFSLIALVGARALALAFQVDRAVGEKARQGRSLDLLRETFSHDCANVISKSPSEDLPVFAQRISEEAGSKVFQLLVSLPPLADPELIPEQAICQIVQYEIAKEPPEDTLLVTRSVSYLLTDLTVTDAEKAPLAQALTTFEIAPQGANSPNEPPKTLKITMEFAIADGERVEYSWAEPIFVRVKEEEE